MKPYVCSKCGCTEYYQCRGDRRCKECQKKEMRAYYSTAAYKELNRRRRSKGKYGLDYQDYEAMATSQNNLCAICGNPPNKYLRIDHNHTTGKIRGLLCDSCNFGIGFLKEDINILKNAIDYIAKYT